MLGIRRGGRLFLETKDGTIEIVVLRDARHGGHVKLALRVPTSVQVEREKVRQRRLQEWS